MPKQGKNGISWTDVSWPVINGCRRVSDGCRGCYAERLAATRLRHNERYKGLAIYTPKGPRWTGASRLIVPELAVPLRLRKPQRIFVADMGDLFFEGNSNEDIAAVFGIMAAAPRHTFQVLTKRPERAAEWFAWAAPGAFDRVLCHADDALKGDGDSRKAFAHLAWAGRGGRPSAWPLSNVHLGFSAEDQETYNARAGKLVHGCPAVVHWASLEPLLGPIDLRGTGSLHLSWIVTGGESGPTARPMDPAWVRSLRDQCVESGIAFHMKQWGAFDANGVKRGKKHTGRVLDGREWLEFPEART
jgi:protein gp37